MGGNAYAYSSGDDIVTLRKRFKLAIDVIQKEVFPDITFIKPDCCNGYGGVISTVFMLLAGRYNFDLSRLGKLDIYFDKNKVNKFNSNIILVGDCACILNKGIQSDFTEENKIDKNIKFINGCPPTISDLMILIAKDFEYLCNFKFK